MTRRAPGWLRAMLADGRLAAAARGAKSWADVARSLGVSVDSLLSAKVRLINEGVQVPTLEELRGAGQQPKLGTPVPDLSRVAPHETKPTVQAVDETAKVDQAVKAVGLGKWPSVDAFDREQRMVVERRSTLYDAEGNIKLVWEKEKAENDERRDWLEAIRDMGGELPRYEPVAPPTHNDNDLLAVYPVGDPHIGLLSWREDSGDNFDLDIAEHDLVAAFQHLTTLAPNASEALLIFIGDTAHADGQGNTTTKGTRVDVDSRTINIARTIIRICRRAIDLALAKHGRVTMIVERGNHDELISAMISLALALAYEHEPRVTIDQSPEMYHWFRFGQNLIGTHHGDKAKPMDLLGVMAVDRAWEWGDCPHRRFYCGHYHHQIVKEVPGLIVEYLPTLASSDAWHRSMGYRSMRAMYMDVFHRLWGHVNRHIVGIGQLRHARAS